MHGQDVLEGLILILGCANNEQEREGGSEHVVLLRVRVRTDPWSWSMGIVRCVYYLLVHALSSHSRHLMWTQASVFDRLLY